MMSADDDACVHPHNKIVAEIKGSISIILKPMLDVILFTFHPHIPRL
jgi:hypothetical protein